MGAVGGREAARLAALDRYDLSEGSGGADLDALTRLAAFIAGVPTAAVNLIDGTTQFQPAATGFPVCTIDRDDSLCAVHFEAGEFVAVPDASRDERFASNPFVDGRNGTIRFYGSVPLITSDGHTLGTLCVFDTVPRTLTPAQVDGLHDLAHVLLSLFERRLQARLATGNASALAERTEELGRRGRQLEILASTSRDLLTSPDPWQAICRAAQQVSGADSAHILRPDGTGRLVSVACVGENSVTTGSAADRGPACAVGTFRTSRPEFVTGTAATRAGSGLDAGFLACATEPVLLPGEEAVGVLVVAWREALAELPGELAPMLRSLANEAAHAVERSEFLARLEHAADHDALTGLANRRQWDRTATEAVDRAERTGEPLTFAIVDLDHFKAYNDTHGHAAGDLLLRSFSAAAVDCLRVVDTLARWGGEEFALALPGCSPEQATGVAARIRSVVPDGQTCTIGIATWTPGATAMEILRAADAALYRGKHGGRDTVVVADASVAAAHERY